MPTVPKLQRQYITGRMPSVRAPETPEIQPFDVRTGGQTLKAAENLFLEEKERIDRTILSEARTAFFKEWERPTLYDPEKGAITRRGRNAIGLSEELTKSLKDYAAKYEQTLGNATQREAYRQFIELRQRYILNWASRHEQEQVRVWQEAETDAAIETSKERAVLSPDAIPIELENIRQKIYERAEQNGWGIEETKQELQKHESDLHVRVIENMLTAKNAVGAREYYSQVASQIDPDVRRKILPAIQAVEKNIRALKLSGDAWDKYGPKDDKSPANLDVMEEEVRKQSNDPDVIKAAISDLTTRVSAHNESVRQRAVANLNQVYADIDSGKTDLEIFSTSHFRNLPENIQHQVRENLRRQREEKRRRQLAEELRKEKARKEALKRPQADMLQYVLNNIDQFKEDDLRKMLYEEKLGTEGFAAAMTALRKAKKEEEKKEEAENYATLAGDDETSQELLIKADLDRMLQEGEISLEDFEKLKLRQSKLKAKKEIEALEQQQDINRINLLADPDAVKKMGWDELEEKRRSGFLSEEGYDDVAKLKRSLEEVTYTTLSTVQQQVKRFWIENGLSLDKDSTGERFFVYFVTEVEKRIADYERINNKKASYEEIQRIIHDIAVEKLLVTIDKGIFHFEYEKPLGALTEEEKSSVERNKIRFREPTSEEKIIGKEGRFILE